MHESVVGSSFVHDMTCRQCGFKTLLKAIQAFCQLSSPQPKWTSVNFELKFSFAKIHLKMSSDFSWINAIMSLCRVRPGSQSSCVFKMKLELSVCNIPCGNRIVQQLAPFVPKQTIIIFFLITSCPLNGRNLLTPMWSGHWWLGIIK